MKASLNNGWEVEGTPEEIFELQLLFWKQEKLDQVTEDIDEKLAKEPKLTRAEVVAQAKRDVAELLSQNYPYKFPSIWFSDKNGCSITDKCDFFINRNKRTVVALITEIDTGDIIYKGIAKCAPDDVFNADIGKAIALRRALGLDVPTEYLHAPKPEGVAVGDVVQYYRNGEESFTHVVNDKHDIDMINRDNRMSIFWTAKVIDDTDREEYRSVGV